MAGPQPKSRSAYGTIAFHAFNVFHVLYLITLLATPRESNNAFQSHPRPFFALAFVSIISILFSGMRLLLHNILVGIWLDTMSTIQDITMAIYLLFYSTALVGGILNTEGISFGNMSLLWPAAILYSAVSQHVLRLLLRFMAFAKWDPFAKWNPWDVSGIVAWLGSPPSEQHLYFYASLMVCVSSMFVSDTLDFVGSEEWATVSGHPQTYVDIQFFRKSILFISVWCCVNLTIRPFLPSPTSILSPTRFYPASISLCFPKLHQLCSGIDLVACVLMFAFAAANSTPLFRMDPILLCRGHTSWISAAFWARQLAIVAVTFFTGVMFLVIRRERSLIHSMTTVEQIRRTIANEINGPQGLEFLVVNEWTSEEIVTLVRLPGLTEKGRDRVVVFLYHERELVEILETALANKEMVYNRGAIYNSVVQNPQLLNAEDEESDLSENWSTPPGSPENSDLELGLGA